MDPDIEDVDPDLDNEPGAEPTTATERARTALSNPTVKIVLISIGVIVALVVIWFIYKSIKYANKHKPVLVDKP